jgi:hypothetical protein
MHNVIRRLTKCRALTAVRERDGNDKDTIDIPVRFILQIPPIIHEYGFGDFKRWIQHLPGASTAWNLDPIAFI